MSTEGRIHKLEGLLERVQRNAQRARAAVPSPAPVEEPSSEPELELAAPVAPSEPPLSPVDDSVDELLNAPAQAPEVAARLPVETIAEVELLEEDDIIDITPEDELAPPAAQEEPGAFDLDRFTEDEEPPASSRRPKVAANMGEALAGAAADLEEREAPLMTPPPESGRQIATSPPGPLQQAPPPADLAALRGDQDVDELLSSAPPPAGPTPEQLGQTVELGEPTAAELELEQTIAGTAPSRHEEELEVTLPGSPVAGSYDAELAPPSGARADLERRQVKAEPKAEAQPAETELSSQVYQRAPVAAKSPVTFVERAAASEPSTFLGLLDASLALHAD